MDGVVRRVQELPDAALASVLVWLRPKDLSSLCTSCTEAAAMQKDGTRDELWLCVADAWKLARPNHRKRTRACTQPWRWLFRSHAHREHCTLVSITRVIEAADAPSKLQALVQPDVIAVDAEIPWAGRTSLLNMACRWGRSRCARLLLDRGADADIADADGFTPLLNAAWSGNLSLCKLILEARPDVDLIAEGRPHKTSSCGGRGPFTARVWAERKGFDSIVRLLDRHDKKRTGQGS